MRTQLSIRWFRTGLCLIAAGALLAAFGCMAPPPRSNAPPQGTTPNPHEMSEQYTYMVDNAKLADMSMSSVHFVPHTSELNALGVRRLNRYASILKIYGGELKYDGAETDDTLKQYRVEAIKEYLVASGVPSDGFEVSTGLAGGAGFRASESINIREGTSVQPGAVEAGMKAPEY